MGGIDKSDWENLEINFEQQGDEDEEDEFERMSLKKLLKYISRTHPRDPETTRSFGICSAVTIKRFWSKLCACV